MLVFMFVLLIGYLNWQIVVLLITLRVCISKEMVLLLRRNVVDLPTNYSLNYYWCSGFMISAFMVVQVITGVILSLLYVADSRLSFRCVMDLRKDSFFTWGVRY